MISSQYHDPGVVSPARPPVHPSSGSVPEIKYEVEYVRGSMGGPGSLAITIVECRVRPCRF